MRRLPAPVGEKFGRLLVVGEGKRTSKERRMDCLCECGNSCSPQLNHLRSGRTTSCGCVRTERIVRERYQMKHGMDGSKAYRRWDAMKARCYNPRHQAFKWYGARGIGVCKRWRESFEAFYADVGEAPEGKSIDRVDNDWHYEPGNWRWATPVEQNRNRRNSNGK